MAAERVTQLRRCIRLVVGPVVACWACTSHRVGLPGCKKNCTSFFIVIEPGKIEEKAVGDRVDSLMASLQRIESQAVTV
jgi:hypothetical protein